MAKQESAWKYLPVLIGVAMGWMIFNPPAFLRELMSKPDPVNAIGGNNVVRPVRRFFGMPGLLRVLKTYSSKPLVSRK
jgi:hypothetical protein